MSSYLSCVLECTTPDLANRMGLLIDRKTRPIFPEDVADLDVELFNIIQSIEFPDRVVIHENYVVAYWLEKDRFDFRHLAPVLSIADVSLALAHEMDTYIGSGDDDEDENGRYWFQEAGKLHSKNVRDVDPSNYSTELGLLKLHEL